jgi:hypothetical protein
MLSKAIPRLFSQIKRNPIFTLRDFKLNNKEEGLSYLKSRIEGVKSPFVVFNLRKFSDTDENLSLLKRCLTELKATENKPIYVWNQPSISAKIKSKLLLSKRQSFPRILLRQRFEDFYKFKNRYMLSEAMKEKYRVRWNRIKDILKSKRVFHHYGYETYAKQVDKIFPKQEDSPPTQGYLREMIFEPKKFMKRMMKSKYFYYIVIFKVVGWILKGYFFLVYLPRKVRNSNKELKEGETQVDK